MDFHTIWNDSYIVSRKVDIRCWTFTNCLICELFPSADLPIMYLQWHVEWIEVSEIGLSMRVIRDLWYTSKAWIMGSQADYAPVSFLDSSSSLIKIRFSSFRFRVRLLICALLFDFFLCLLWLWTREHESDKWSYYDPSRNRNTILKLKGKSTLIILSWLIRNRKWEEQLGQ